MCYNYKTSFYAFLIAFVSGLILLTDNDYENRTMGVVCILVSLIQLKESIKKSVIKIKEESYKNYFIYAYNKDYYKNKKNSKKSTKHKPDKIYKE